MIKKDYTGHRFGRLVVIGLAYQRKNINYWNCKCDCGVNKNINGCGLISKRIVSCGCYNKELTLAPENAKHRHSIKDITTSRVGA